MYIALSSSVSLDVSLCIPRSLYLPLVMYVSLHLAVVAVNACLIRGKIEIGSAGGLLGDERALERGGLKGGQLIRAQNGGSGVDVLTAVGFEQGWWS